MRFFSRFILSIQNSNKNIYLMKLKMIKYLKKKIKSNILKYHYVWKYKLLIIVNY